MDSEQGPVKVFFETRYEAMQFADALNYQFATKHTADKTDQNDYSVTFDNNKVVQQLAFWKGWCRRKDYENNTITLPAACGTEVTNIQHIHESELVGLFKCFFPTTIHGNMTKQALYIIKQLKDALNP